MVGRTVYAEVNEEFKRGPQLNEELLMRILRDNKDTEYGKKYGFADITSVEEYQRRVPVIVYDNIAGDLERMCDGEKNILTAYPFTHMICQKKISAKRFRYRRRSLHSVLRTVPTEEFRFWWASLRKKP